MDRISVTLPSDQIVRIDDRMGDEYESRSEAVRRLLERGFEYDDLHTENERLQNRVRKLIDAREEHTELVEYVEEERSLQQRREERREERENAAAWTRAKWWLVGRPDDERAE